MSSYIYIFWVTCIPSCNGQNQLPSARKLAHYHLPSFLVPHPMEIPFEEPGFEELDVEELGEDDKGRKVGEVVKAGKTGDAGDIGEQGHHPVKNVTNGLLGAVLLYSLNRGCYPMEDTLEGLETVPTEQMAWGW